MLNRIIHFSLNNRLLVLVAAILLMFVGVYTASRMEVDVFPDLNAPTVVVMTEANGMAPEEVERLVTFPVETSLNGATDVRRVRSSSTTGFSVVWVEFEWGTDIYRARQIVSEKLAAASALLPEGVGAPTLGPQSSILGELMTISLTSDTTSLRDLRTLADWTIRPRLLATGGVAQVSVLGGEVKEYQILLSPEKMRHYGVALSDVTAAVEEMNRNVSGGILYEYGNEYIIRGMLSSHDIGLLSASLVKRTESGAAITLADIAEVKVGNHAPKTGVASYNAHPSVVLTVTKQPNVSTIDLTEKIDLALNELKDQLPDDIEIHSDVYRQSRFIESSVNNVRQALIEGAVFVVVILFLFLANVRTTVISLVTIPIALLTSILVLHLLGLTINTMSLGGLCIAIGSLVDDAIVDVENVFKRLRENNSLPAHLRKKPLDVIFKASSEVRMPILNSTLIIVASFAPLFFLSGMEGRMLVPLGIAFIVALASSTVVALTLTPVLCSYLLGKKKNGLTVKDNAKESVISRWMKSIYLYLLRGALAHHRPVLAGTATALVLAIVLFAGMGSSFLPSFNEGSFTINVSTLPGVSLEESDSIGSRAERALMTIPEIEVVGRKTGRAELDEHALGVNTSEIEAPFVLGDRSKEEVVADIREKLHAIPGVNIEVGSPISHRIDAMLSGTRASIAIKIFGPDLNRLFAIGNEIRKEINEIEGIADLNVEQQVERPQLTITPKRTMMARYGVTMAEFGQLVNTLLAGETVSQVYEGDKSFDLVLKVDDDHRRGIGDIRSLMVNTPQGEVPLSTIANISSTAGPNTINRENVTRKVVVSANVSGRDLRGVVTDIQDIVAERVHLPEDYHIEYGGQFESQETAMRTLTIVSLVSLIVILLLLWNEFRSIKQSALILLNLPLALIGGIVAIWLTGGVISIPSVIGFISLFGIATRNGMLLIARYNDLARAGLSTKDSVLIGSADRLNPIMMTALTSALALIPMVIGSDKPGNEIQSPMAVVILGGLVTSTLLNGFIIPIVYLMASPGKLDSPSSTAKHPSTLMLILFLLLLPLATHAQDYSSALSTIASNNTTLSALFHRAEAERLSNRSEAYLDAPEFGFNYLWGHPSDIGQRQDISVSQPLSIATISGQRHRVAYGLNAMVDTRLSQDRMSIMLEAKELLIDMVYFNAMLNEMESRIAAAYTIANMQQQRLSSGDGTRLDLNNALLALSSLRADSLRLASERATTSAQLTRLNGGKKLDFNFSSFEDLSLPTDFNSWYTSIADYQPEIAMASRQLELSSRQLSLAKTELLPDITVGYMSEKTSGERYQGVTLGISIPLWNSRNKLRQARANIQASRAEQADAVLQQRSRMETLFHQAQTLHSLTLLYSHALSECCNMPLSAKALQAGEISQIDFITQASIYYDTFDQWLTAQRDYHKAHAVLHAFELK